jgi:hypothetical protein
MGGKINIRREILNGLKSFGNASKKVLTSKKTLGAIGGLAGASIASLGGPELAPVGAVIGSQLGSNLGNGLIQDLKRKTNKTIDWSKEQSGLGLMQDVEHLGNHTINKTRKTLGVDMRKMPPKRIMTQGNLINGVSVDNHIHNDETFTPHQPYEYQQYLKNMSRHHMKKRGGSFLPI